MTTTNSIHFGSRWRPARSMVVVCCWMAAIFSIGMVTSAGAQTTTDQPVAPTAEQLKLLESLSPEEREALFDALTDRAGQPTEEPLEVPELLPPTPEEEEMRRRLLGLEDEELLEEEEEPRVEGEDLLVVTLELRDDISPEDELLVTEDPRLDRLIGSRTYKLDRFGVMTIPGVTSIPLTGLLAEEAAKRIEAEPDLRYFTAEVTLLPLEPTGTEALEPFGYELFENVPSTFAPVTEIPVPPNYVIGPDDVIRVQLFGNQNADYSLIVDRDGVINFPGIGPIAVAGMGFAALRDDIQTRVREQMIGVQSSVTMGELRSIRVFILGEAVLPGSYTVSGLSTMTNALFVSGGIKPIGSLRNIQLKRGGEVVSRLDLYDLLLHGDTSGDARLEPGDVIFVPPVGPTVGAGGEVNRPAIYELKDESTAGELVEIAGGLTPEAYSQASQIERVRGDRGRTIVGLDLSTPEGQATRLRPGDTLTVHSILDQLEDAVLLSGHAQRPGGYEWRPGMRLTDLIPGISSLKPNADMRYLLIRREHPQEGRIEILSADLSAAWREPGSAADPLLEPRDQISVFDLEYGRAAIVQPLLNELQLYATAKHPFHEVGIGGRVKAPGQYPLESGMRVSDLLRAGGGLDEAAYELGAELARYDIVDGEYRETDLIEIDLAAVLDGDQDANLLLQAHDFVNIKEIPHWEDQDQIEILGEVMFPGTYPVRRGETLSSVVERAGGLTDLAFADGSIFIREDLKEREREQIETLAQRLQTDLAAFSLQTIQESTGAAQAFSIGQSLLTELRQTEPTGRLVIDIGRIMANQGDPIHDIVVKDGDRLLIPERTQEVTVLGEVQYATSHIYEPGMDRDDYIERSGGPTARADSDRIYVVRANGSVVSGADSLWFRKMGGQEIRPGDTIVVPLDAARVSPLTMWTSVTQIIYNLAIAVAAVNSF
ncbi:MAG: SLBB domain-containing protein [Gammaproteobacteria bacterium]